LTTTPSDGLFLSRKSFHDKDFLFLGTLRGGGSSQPISGLFGTGYAFGWASDSRSILAAFPANWSRIDHPCYVFFAIAA
jgi:hypothetical protein